MPGLPAFREQASLDPLLCSQLPLVRGVTPPILLVHGDVSAALAIVFRDVDVLFVTAAGCAVVAIVPTDRDGNLVPVAGFAAFAIVPTDVEDAHRDVTRQLGSHKHTALRSR